MAVDPEGGVMMSTRAFVLAGSLVLLATNGATTIALTTDGNPPHGKADHVLLLSIDGFHQLDLERYVAGHPASALAALVARGAQYTNTTSSRPSDSFPGTLAMTTGGSPSST